MAVQLDHYDQYGDVYATLDTCDELESLLNRLRREGFYGDGEWMRGRQHLAEIRAGLERLAPVAFADRVLAIADMLG